MGSASCFINCEGQSHRLCPQVTIFEEMWQPKSNRTEVLLRQFLSFLKPLKLTLFVLFFLSLIVVMLSFLALVRFSLIKFKEWSAALLASSAKLINLSTLGAGIAQWLKRRTRDWKVAGSNPCWNGGRIFFSKVDFLCWLLFRYPFHPRVTTVACKKSRSFCQKCRWQVTAKHAYTLRMWLLLNRASALVTTCP